MPQIMDFVVARYGEFVLLKPRFSAAHCPSVVWAFPDSCRRRGFIAAPPSQAGDALSQAEQALAPTKRRRLESSAARRLVFAASLTNLS